MPIINKNDENAVEMALKYLKNGDIIAFATDTVYGFGVDATNFTAVDALYQAKQRSRQNPIAIFVPNLKSAQKILDFSEKALEIAKKYLPGALTMVLRKKNNDNLAKNLNQNDDFLGFRYVEDDFIAKILTKTQFLAVTSANISGQPPANNAKELANNFKMSQNILIIDCGPTPEKTPSTVIKINDDKVEILRQGKLKLCNN